MMHPSIRALGCLSIISLVFLLGCTGTGDPSNASFIAPQQGENAVIQENVASGYPMHNEIPPLSENSSRTSEAASPDSYLNETLSARTEVPQGRSSLSDGAYSSLAVPENSGIGNENPVSEIQMASLAPSATIILNEGNLQGATGSKYWVINSPGTYQVNLASGQLVTANQYAILIRSSNVYIDGTNTALIHSGERAGTYGLWVQNGALSNVSLLNFRVSQFDHGIQVENLNSGTLKYLTVENNIVGIWVYNSQAIIVENCIAQNRNEFGIFLNKCYNSHIRNNDIHDNIEGFYLIEGENNAIYGNSAVHNDLTGIYLGYEVTTDNNLVYGNTAQYNDYGILLDRYCDYNSVYSNDARYNRLGGIMLVKDSYNKVYDNNVSNNNEVGIFLHSDNSYNEIYSNDVSSNHHGIVLVNNCHHNNVYENTVSSNSDRGIWVSDNSASNSVSLNAISGNGYGLLIYLSSNNVLKQNTVNNNVYAGIYLDRSSGSNTINDNRVTGNGAGIYLFGSNNEKIHNNYLNNVKNVGLAGSNTNNKWNTEKTAGTNIVNGPYLGGNFYATPDNTGFSQVTPDADHDGICDTPYTFKTDDGAPAVNTDYLPLHEYSVVQTGTKIGVFRNGFWILDKNGNFQWDGPPGDIVVGFGTTGDVPVVADWNSDTKDNMGIFRNGFWTLDLNGNFQWDGSPGDIATGFGATGDVPVVADWSGEGSPEIGVFRASAGQWILDANGNFLWDGTGTGKDVVAILGQSGDKPVPGNWNAAGSDDIGIFRNGFWILDGNGNFQWDGPPGDIVAGFGTTGDVPVVADWNSDTKDNIGIFRNGFWILDYNGNFQWDDVGTGKDLVAGFGASGDVPVIKDWNGDGAPEIAVFRAATGQWIIDYNRNFRWDGTSAGQDVVAILGQSGDKAVAGEW